jgi:hypothetical protein
MVHLTVLSESFSAGEWCHEDPSSDDPPTAQNRPDTDAKDICRSVTATVLPPVVTVKLGATAVTFNKGKTRNLELLLLPNIRSSYVLAKVTVTLPTGIAGVSHITDISVAALQSTNTVPKTHWQAVVCVNPVALKVTLEPPKVEPCAGNIEDIAPVSL